MLHTQKRQKASIHSGPSLRRLPRDFSWSLMYCLGSCLRSWLSEEENKRFDTVCRSRQPAEIARLKEEWAPVVTVGPTAETPQHVAVKLLLARMFSKDESLCTVEKDARREKCIQSVLDLDAALAVPVLREPDHPLLGALKQEVAYILGPLPEWDELNDHARHGPGSTALTSYAKRSSYFKYAEWPYAVTPGCRELFKRCISQDLRWLGSLEQSYRERYDIPAWSVLDWEVFWSVILVDQPANVITTVPKDGSKDRPIAKEPLGNVYCQTAVGAFLKRRLLRLGVDLTDQTKNQSLARLASVWDSPLSPCTFDLSNASDTIHTDLVRAIVPPEWFNMLVALRSPWGEVPDRMAWRYAKMSSMGNATTFELESTIFYALLRATVKLHGDRTDFRYISVFGDDMVFPRYLADPVAVYLKACGFTPNITKSFSAGSFFESCGKDWFQGINVRPVYCKAPPEDIMELIGLRNRLNCWFARVFGTTCPLTVDNFFLKYIDGSMDAYSGPEDNDATEGFWHRPPGQCSARREHRVLIRRTAVIPGRDLWFRKLMHDLRNCEAPFGGSRFEISELSGKVGVSSRAPQSCGTLWYEEDGVRQDHVRPAWETTLA